jgi:proteic killer suppression protein
VIKSFRSKALRLYWTKGNARGIRADWQPRLRLILLRLDEAAEPAHMNSPGLSFHALTSNLQGRYAVLVSRNWRVTFAFDGTDAVDVDLEDYHGR